MRNARRFRILERDGFACRYCGAKAPDIRLEVDHVVPKSKGGKDRDDNLVTACFPCNRGKRDREGVLPPLIPDLCPNCDEPEPVAPGNAYCQWHSDEMDELTFATPFPRDTQYTHDLIAGHEES